MTTVCNQILVSAPLVMKNYSVTALVTKLYYIICFKLKKEPWNCVIHY